MNIEKNKYRFCEDSYSGEGGYSSFSDEYSYLIKFPRESNLYFKDRRRTSQLTNIYKPMLNLFYHPISSKSLDVVVNTNNKNLKKDIKQTKMIRRSNQALLDVIKFDSCLFAISTDINNDGTPNTDLYPEISNIFPGDLKNMRMNGLDIHSAIYYEHEYIDTTKVPIEVEYYENVFLKITKAWITEDNQIILTDLGEDRRIKTFDGMFYGVLSTLGEEISNTTTPYSYDLAISQFKIFQLDSDTRSVLRRSGYPQLIIQSDKKDLKLVTGSANGIQVGADDKAPSLLEPALTSVEIGREIIEKDIEYIYKTWTQGLLSSNIVYNSATSSAIATKTFQNTVNVYYNYYKDIVETMLNSFDFIYNYNTVYDIDFGEGLDLNETSMKEQIDNITSGLE